MDTATIARTLKHSPSLHQQQPLFSQVMDPTHPLHYIRSFSKSHNKTSSKPQDTDIRIFDAHMYFGQSDDPRLSSSSADGNHRKNNVRTRSNHATPTASTNASWNSETGLLDNHPGSVKVSLNNSASKKSSSSGHHGKNNIRTRSFHATPTASADSSWNSESGLLATPPRSVKVSRDNVASKKSSSSGKKSLDNVANKKSIFGRSKCCCTGKESVRVKEATSPPPPPPTPTTSDSNNSHKNKNKKSTKSEKVPIPKSTIMSHRSSIPTHSPNPIVLSPREKSDPSRQQRISASGKPFVGGATSGFSFPILKNPNQAAVRPPGGFKGRITKAIVSPLDEDPDPRDSLEVYQPTETDNTTPPARHRQFHPSSPIAMTTDDDMGSDASSDLFELDSFSTQTSLYPMYRRRDSLDEAPTFNNNNSSSSNIQHDRHSLDEPPAPSEVSIEWSVNTAEGVSNFPASAPDGGKRRGNGGGGGLLSCRQGKAVSVGPQPVKCSQAEGSGRPPRGRKTTTKGSGRR